MYRRALLLCAVAGLGAVGAPAPSPRPLRPWDTGWARPRDPLGDCRFDRSGGKLTITVPGPGHDLDVLGGHLNAPRLLRTVEGDFTVTVRVGGRFCPAGKSGYHRAGLLLTDGKLFIKVQRVAAPEGVVDSCGAATSPLCVETTALGDRQIQFFASPPPPGLPEGPVYLRLERQGGRLRAEFSEDSKSWIRMRASIDGSDDFELPATVKVGVVAESSAAGTFAPWFDQFDLTRPKR